MDGYTYDGNRMNLEGNRQGYKPIDDEMSHDVVKMSEGGEMDYQSLGNDVQRNKLKYTAKIPQP